MVSAGLGKCERVDRLASGFGRKALIKSVLSDTQSSGMTKVFGMTDKFTSCSACTYELNI